MTRNQARELFANSGLRYQSLTRENLQRLRNLINVKMKVSKLFKETYRCKQRPEFKPDGHRFWAGIRCSAFYFENREAVSFNDDRFIGFAGWAADDNVQPILEGFAEWVTELSGK